MCLDNLYINNISLKRSTISVYFYLYNLYTKIGFANLYFNKDFFRIFPISPKCACTTCT